MTPDRHRQVKELFEKALGLSDAERSAWLERACAGDVALKKEVETLLVHDARARAEASAMGAGVPGVIGASAPEWVGPYKVLATLGSGGFGVVYLAEQSEPIRRRVAVKVIKPGMASEHVLARFEAERHALALMDHPNVAKVLDAGATADGRPYFVMEHVPGEPITAYCDKHNLTTRQRLQLVVPVCEALQHAHSKGIIHRDIKPSNVLVMVAGDAAVPKIIDFGVAKAIDRQLSEHTLFTEMGQLIGTPEYMSPEQAEMGALDIDTRSDIYSLGVLLYELLTGALPFDTRTLRAGALMEIQRIIREVEPPRPSTRLSGLGNGALEIARHRQTGIEALAVELRRELEWIPLKAMRKDRTQRYRTAADMADDIRNYLSGRPLIAGPESVAYKAKKFARRHRVGVVAGIAVSLAIIIGGVGTVVGLVRARDERDRAEMSRRNAETSRQQADSVTTFLASVLAEPGPYGRDVRVRDLLGRLPAEIEQKFADQPSVAARLHSTIGRAYLALDMADEAGKEIERAASQAEKSAGRESVAYADALAARAVLKIRHGDPTAAVALCRETLALRKRLVGERDRAVAQDLQSLGHALDRAGDLKGAEENLRAAYQLDRSIAAQPGSAHVENYEVCSDLASVLDQGGKYEEAERLYKEAIELVRKHHGEAHPRMAQSLSDLGRHVLAMLGQPQAEEAGVRTRAAEAADLFQRAMAIDRSFYGETHVMVAINMVNLGKATMLQGKLEEAETILREAATRLKAALGESHADSTIAVMTLTEVLRQRGKLDESEALLNGLLALAETGQNIDAVLMARALDQLGGTYLRQRNDPKAAWAFRGAIDMWKRAGQADGQWSVSDKRNLSGVLSRLGQLDEAEKLAEEALQGLRKINGEKHLMTVEAMRGLGYVRVGRGTKDKAETAEPLLRECIKLYGEIEIPEPERWRSARAESTLGECLTILGKHTEAEALLIKSLEKLRTAPTTPPNEVQLAATRLVKLFRAEGKNDEAAKLEAQQSAPKPEGKK